MTQEAYKIKSAGQQSAFSAYRQLCYGNVSLGFVLRAEATMSLVGGIPGAAGLVLRKALFPGLFSECGSKVIFGRNLTLRHSKKIRIGDNTIIDENVVLDAKGDSNQGISIGRNVYIGRNTIIYSKNGNIRIGDNVNVSSNCQIFSAGDLEIGKDTVIAAYAYLLNGGQYDTTDKETPFSQQNGMITKGPTRIGENCWIAAHATITDGVTIGKHSVIAAGAVVTKDIPANVLAAGTPAIVKRPL